MAAEGQESNPSILDSSMIWQIYILPLKFDPNLIAGLTAQFTLPNKLIVVFNPSSADLIVTKLHQKRRLERELRLLPIAKSVLVFKYDSIMPLYETCSIPVARERAWCIYRPPVSTIPCLIRIEKPIVTDRLSIVSNLGVRSHSPTEVEGLDTFQSSSAQARAQSPQMKFLMRHESSADPSSVRYSPHEIQAALTCNAKFACERFSPLTSQNEGIIRALDLLRLARTLQDDLVGVRAYSTAIASLKAYEQRISAASEIRGLEGLGPKLISMVQEFLNTGSIEEVSTTWADVNLKTLLLFWRIHGVGASTARDWVNNLGYRDLNDAILNWNSWPRSIQIGLKHYEDFLCTISRQEVQQIATFIADASRDVIAKVATASKTDISFTICGGFRRGKMESNDVDLVITHESSPDRKCFLMILDQLHSQGHIEDVISVTHDEAGSEASEFGLSIALVVFLSPLSTTTRPLRRRVDIILAKPASYVPCILGWSGSRTFVRDLRRYTSKVKNWKFDSTGLTMEDTGKRISKASIMWFPGADMIVLERALFELLDLSYIPPAFRNAD